MHTRALLASVGGSSNGLFQLIYTTSTSTSSSCSHLLLKMEMDLSHNIQNDHLITNTNTKSSSSQYTTSSNLLSALGLANVEVEFNDSDAVQLGTSKNSSGGTKGILNSLSKSIKKDLLQAQNKLQLQLQVSKNEVNDNNEKSSLYAVLETKKRSRQYLDVSSDSFEPFMKRLQTSTSTQLLASDWEMVKVLLHTNSISLVEHSTLLPMAYEAQRLDVILSIAQFGADLTESDAVLFLKLCAALPPSCLDRYQYKDGVLSFKPPVQQQQLSQQPSQTLLVNGLNHSATDTPSKTKGKTSKTKDKSKMNTTTDTVTTVATTNTKTGKNSHKNNDTMTCTPLIALQLVVQAILQRASAFSLVVLVDALKTLSVSFCSLLIRVFIEFIHGNDYVFTSYNSYILQDDMIKRAVVWIEALLDSHFATLAMNATLEGHTRRSLVCAMELISSVDVAVDDLELMLGLCTHIRRQIISGVDVRGQQQYSMYEMETLTL
eukprot:gene10442-21789_t